MTKIKSRGILRDEYFIEVRIEEDISINNDNLPAPDNLQVPEVAANSIFNNKFDHNLFLHTRMYNIMDLTVELLPSVAGGIDIITTRLHIFELVTPKSFIKEVVIP